MRNCSLVETGVLVHDTLAPRSPSATEEPAAVGAAGFG